MFNHLSFNQPNNNFVTCEHGHKEEEIYKANGIAVQHNLKWDKWLIKCSYTSLSNIAPVKT